MGVGRGGFQGSCLFIWHTAQPFSRIFSRNWLEVRQYSSFYPMPEISDFQRTNSEFAKSEQKYPVKITFGRAYLILCFGSLGLLKLVCVCVLPTQRKIDFQHSAFLLHIYTKSSPSANLFPESMWKNDQCHATSILN
jgi:hypothetical protein